MPPSLIPRIVTACLLGLCLLGSTSSPAVAVRYSYDDSATDPSFFKVGSGTFCLDVDDPLGSYAARDVVGGGGVLGAWAGFSFEARIGTPPSLTISNLVGASVTTALSRAPAEAGDQASVRWVEFIDLARNVGIVITALGTCVPDSGSPMLMTLGTVSGLVGFVGFRRRRDRRKSAQGSD